MKDDGHSTDRFLLADVAPAKAEPVTPLAYLNEVAVMTGRHSGELLVAMASVTGVVLGVLGIRSLLHPQADVDPVHVLFVLLPFLFAAFLFEAAAAAWRLYRRQGIALASTRSLLDLNAADRVELERHLEWRFRRREARIHERNSARVDRLDDTIVDLQTEAESSSRKAAAEADDRVTAALGRAEDDGWPVGDGVASGVRQ